jgi:hypothetical protein
MTAKGPFLAARKTLQPGDSLVSLNGKYVAYFDDNGKLGLYLAVSGTDGQPDLNSCYWQTPAAAGSQPWAVMQDDTNFVLYHQPDGIPYFASNTVLNVPGITALLDDGNLVVCTGTSSADPQEIVWSALPAISASCKLMQNYRVTAPVNGGPEVLAIRTGSGIELFTLGTGGDIHTFYPDPASETGYSQAALTSGFAFTHLAGAADGAGHAVLFASAGQQIYVLAETGDPAKRWGNPQPVTTATMPVVDMVARTIGGTVILLAIQKDSGGYYWPAVLRWGIDDKVNPNGKLKMTGSQPLPLLQVTIAVPGGQAEPTATLVVPGKLVLWGLNSGNSGTVPVSAAPVTPRNVDVATDGTGAEWIVGTPPGQPVCRLTPAAGGEYAWTPLWQPLFYMDDLIEFLHVIVEPDASGAMHVFAASAPQVIVEGDPTKYNVLYHRPPTSDTSLDPVPIHKSVGMKLAGVANDAGSIDLFTVEAANLVDHLFLEQTGSNWASQHVLDPAGDDAPITDYASYATDITVYDGDRAILTGEYVDVYATDRSRVEINGLTWFLDEQTPAHVPTNGAGMLCISQETGSLASAPLRVVLAADRISAKAPVIEVDPYADVQHQLGIKSAQDLLEAEMIMNDDGAKSLLLQGSYREGTTPESLASALDTFLGGAQGSGNLGSAALLSTGTGRAQDRFWSRQPPQASGPHQPPARRPAPVRADRPCRITFHDGGLTYEPLTAQEAADLRATSMATLPSVTSAGFGQWWSKIGDALKSVAEGIASVAEVVWTGLTATVNLIVDGVTYFFDTVVQFIEDALDMVEMIFTYVKVFFEQLYRWLALIFDWTSIKQAARCVTWSFDQMLAFLDGMVNGLRPIADARYAAFKDQFAAMMDELINAVSGTYSVGGYIQRNSPYNADADSATSNNFYLNEFIANVGTSGPPALAAQLAASGPVSTLADLFTQLTDLELPTAEFAAAQDYFIKLGTNPDAIFTNTLSLMLTVLKGIGMVGLKLGAQIVDALLTAVREILDLFGKTVRATLYLPFVSTFYKWITGQDLSLLNLMGLATGIPSAVFYAITTGERMFTASSGPGSADELCSMINSDAMLQAVGLASAPATASTPLVITQKTANSMAGTYLAVTAVGGVLAGGAEFKLPDWVAPLTWINYGSIACSVLSSVFSFPYFYASTGSMSIEEDIWMAISFAQVGGAFFYSWLNKLPSNAANDVMAVSFTFGGVLLLAQAGYLSRDEPDGRLVGWRIIQRLPWVFKFLRLTAIQRATFTFSLFALAQLDVDCGYAGGVLGYLVLRERYTTP